MRRILFVVMIAASTANLFSNEIYAVARNKKQNHTTHSFHPASVLVKDNVEQAVRQAENERIKALVQNDFKTLDRILADDMIYTHSTGVAETKAKWMENLKTGEVRYESFEPDDVKVRVYDDAAIMNGRAKIKTRTKNGQENSVLLRFTSVYVKRQGRWQFATWQSTRVTQ